jgi:hypothetical protein
LVLANDETTVKKASADNTERARSSFKIFMRLSLKRGRVQFYASCSANQEFADSTDALVSKQLVGMALRGLDR